jgi:deoxyribodipyrimidine photo-lyase
MWFRRDLRLHDNAALYHALKSKLPVLCVFIFDKNILDFLEDKNDKRVSFIHQCIETLHVQLKNSGSTLLVMHDTPLNAWKKITSEYDVKHVFANHDYEPYATEREQVLTDFFTKQKIDFSTYKDQVIFEKDEVTKDDGLPYTVFTPYSKKWKAKLTSFHLKSYPTEKYFSNFVQLNPIPFPALNVLGFNEVKKPFSHPELDESLITKYAEQRNFPAVAGTTRLSVHLRFGTVSIRQLAAKAQTLSETWLNELIWREFYMMILYHFPQVDKAFKRKYDNIPWNNKEEEFVAWCEGRTGYPIVDAGMRQLNETGFMHNRVRMITASFLVKHLLIDWRWGESYFAKKLLDFELASNNGGWQWAASSGCDAAPYFRIFNPEEQTKRFDPKLRYIRQWVPELEDFSYPKPIVEHRFARERCLRVFKEALQ